MRAVARDQRACPPTDADDVKKYPARVRVPHRAPPTAYYVYDPGVWHPYVMSVRGVCAPCGPCTPKLEVHGPRARALT